MKKIRTIDDFNLLRNNILASETSYKSIISISAGTCGQACGAMGVADSIKSEVLRHKLNGEVRVKLTGCHGFCEAEPNIIIYPEGYFYQKLKPEDAVEIINETVINKRVVDRLLYKNPKSKKRIALERDIPFYKKQQRWVLGSNPFIDPSNIDDYIARGGYITLSKVLSGMERGSIIDIIKKSGLRGRGGAGFLTGLKWELCKKAKGEIKYIVCNADEGDPGAYMDRSLLEGNPHSIIEGMVIGAYAIGSNEGYIYVRNEYPVAVKNATRAIEQAGDYGFLGKDIIGSGFDFDIKIITGAGAFVCGEETALIASLEGKVGIPRQRPPYPVEKGFHGKPTNINNVETWANVPLIINNGADWFSSVGTEKSKGTKVFSLVGKIKNTGLVEVPMGMTLKEIVHDIGGGNPDGKKIKAVQTGGPSGGCIPDRLFNIPIDFDELTHVGSMMGSGGMIVMDEGTCMVDVARYFLNFLKDESCGKCLSCREGIQRMLEILTNITSGKGQEGDVELLEELASVVKDTSMCGLGQTAANPVLSTIKYFRREYNLHIRHRRCSAKVCKELINFYIIPEKCTGCQRCVKVCPTEAISGPRAEPHNLDRLKCIKCAACYEICKFNAIDDIIVDAIVIR